MTRSPNHIVLIVADSLRYDSVYRDGNPRTTYMNEHAIQFDQARSSGCWTLPAHASIFTGMMPHEHGATTQTRRISAPTLTLAEHLKQAGYVTHQVTANVVTTEVFGLSRGFDRVHKIWEMVAPRFKSLYNTFIMLAKPRIRRLLVSPKGIAGQLTKDMAVSKTWVQNTHRDIFRRANKILREATKQGERVFMYLNLMETHFPYHIGPTFRLSARGVGGQLGELAGLWHLVNQSHLTDDREHIPPRVREILRNRQDLSWRLLSKPLDRFVQRWHEKGDNLIVFASDHGDNFGEQGMFYHFTNVTDAGNRVPVFWLGNDLSAAQTLHHPTSTRYIFDEILDAADISPRRGGGLFSETEVNLPILESYWYNNAGRTLEKYKYNQLAFVDGDRRYLKRKGEWFAAPVQRQVELEDPFEPLGPGVNPIEEYVVDRKRQTYLRDTVNSFDTFASKIPT